MTKYVEFVFLENLIINIIIIHQISTFTKSKPKKINIIIGIIIINVYSVANYYLYDLFVSNFFVKFLIVNISMFIIYRPRKIKFYFKTILYYFLNLLLFSGIIIGITLFFDIKFKNETIKIVVYIISALILYLFNKFMWKMWKSNIKNDDLIYKIKIGDIVISAFIDTGNTVCDKKNNLDILFVEYKYKKYIEKNQSLRVPVTIDISTVTNKEECIAYLLKDVKIIKNDEEIYKFKKVEIIFITKKLDINNDYNALISYNTYLERLKGVTLC